GEIGPVDGKRFQRGDQMLLGIRLEHESADPGLEPVHDDLFPLVHRVEEDLDARQLALQGMGKVQPVHFRNRVIEDRDVRFRFPRELQTGPAVRRLADNLQVGLRFKELANTATDRVVIVYDNDPSDWARHMLGCPARIMRTQSHGSPWRLLCGSELHPVSRNRLSARAPSSISYEQNHY